MTIAVCYLSPEGVVLGADSTTSTSGANGFHYFDFNQKLFEFGQESTFGVLTWGLGGLGEVSYRTIIARAADRLDANPAASVQDAVNAFVDEFSGVYTNFGPVQRAQLLNSKLPFVAGGADPNARTQLEEAELGNLRSVLFVGFCIAGYASPGRIPEAFVVTFDPTLTVRPTGVAMQMDSTQWWGVPNVIQRMVHGADDNLRHAIMTSGKWTGTLQELNDLIALQSFRHASLPIRDAIDYVYSCIHCTIKAMKFSSLPQVCGGPIEVAVITTDRKFRWVRHKQFSAAINDGESDE